MPPESVDPKGAIITSDLFHNSLELCKGIRTVPLSLAITPLTSTDSFSSSVVQKEMRSHTCILSNVVVASV